MKSQILEQRCGFALIEREACATAFLYPDFVTIEVLSMANHDHAAGSAMDYAEHERTYSMFLGLVKWGSIFVVALLVGMAIFLI